MRALADAAHYFAPELEIADLPGLGLPALRPRLAVAALDVRAAGGAARAAAQAPTKPQLLVTTVNAATAAHADAVPHPPARRAARARRADRPRPARRPALRPTAMCRTDTVRDAGEFAVRGGLVDLFPAGEEQALRLDFFGDEIESVRRFDPATSAPSTGSTASPCSPPPRPCSTRTASSASAAAIARLFGATATGDPLYQACRDGRRLAGHGALAAAVRGAAGDPVRPSRPTTT